MNGDQSNSPACPSTDLETRPTVSSPVPSPGRVALERVLRSDVCHSTNLFDAQQAEAMVRYMAEGLPEKASPPLTIDATAATGQGNTAFGLPVKANEPQDAFERMRAALQKLTNGYKYSTEVCQIAREALGPQKTSEAWVCPKCQQLNSAGTTTCGRCEDL